MTLSYSRDPFCCFTTSMDLATFWDCHRRAFAHFGGVPGSVVYDRTKTVIKRHVAPKLAVPLHPEAAAFAEHYGFSVDVLAAYRPTVSAPRRIGPASLRCPTGLMWRRRSICAASARTVRWRLRPACIRCRPGRCGPGSGCSCISARTQLVTASTFMPSPWTHPRAIRGAPGWSTLRIGMGRPTGTPAHHRRGCRTRPARRCGPAGGGGAVGGIVDPAARWLTVATRSLSHYAQAAGFERRQGR